MDFTGEPREHDPFELWRGDQRVSTHRTLHSAQIAKMRGGAEYEIRCRVWEPPTPGLFKSWVTPVGLLAILAASVIAGWLIVRGGL